MGVAGLYLLQQAEFLFAVQIVLYIGGIMVLFLFVIMLVNLDQAAKEKQFNGQWMDRAGVRRPGRRCRFSGSFRKGRARFRSRSPARCRRRPHSEIPSNWPTCCLRSICCRLKLLPFCCWWQWWGR